MEQAHSQQVVRVPSKLERTLLVYIRESHRGHENCDVNRLAEFAEWLLAYYDSAEQPGGGRNPIALRGAALLRDLAEPPRMGERSYVALGPATRAELARLAGMLESTARPKADEICENCGLTYAGHLSNTGVLHPCWKGTGLYKKPTTVAADD